MKRKCLFLSFAIVFLTLFLSCENAFLPVPGYEGGFDRGSASAEVPVELNASQGYKREITFTWTPVAGAVRYNIYRSDTPGGDFQLIGESSSDAATQTIMQPQGTDAWYRVAAVKYNGVKDMSHPVRGTTLAQPIITDVEGAKGNADSEIWVYWYMGNDDAYRDSVMYTVYAYDGANPSVPLAHRTVGGDPNYATAALFDNLDPNKKYVFEVEAYNVNDQDKIEKSPKQDAETARRLRPNAPKNLKISQGDSKDTINIQFDLPVKVDVNHGTEDVPIYYEHDLFFKIYRRKEGNTQWDEICSYFGKKQNPVGVTGSGAKVQFTSPEGATYSDYKPEEYTVVYKDKSNLERGVKYEYKVQSYQDTSIENGVSADKNILSTSTSTDKSISYGTGWTINVPIFFTKDLNVVTDEDKTKITDVSVGFGMEFETHGLYDKYKYLIVEYSQPDNNTNTYTGRKELCSTEYDLETFVYKWSENETEPNKITADIKHYVYKLFIFNSSIDISSIADDRWADSALDSTTAHGRISVGSRPGTKPVFEMFSLISGYADKFEIKWKYNDDYEYELYYKEGNDPLYHVIRPGTDSDLNRLFVEAIDRKTDNDIVTFIHSAGAGVERTYYLRASSGVYTTDTPPLTGKTLSRPDIKQYDYDYDKVGVKWLDTTDAKKFEFNIEGVSKFEKTRDDLTPNRTENNEFLYTFQNTDQKQEISENYKDATKSGLPMSLKVAAIGDVTEEKFDATRGVINSDTPKDKAITTVIAHDARAESEIQVRTLGPALTNPSVTVATSVDSINFTWNKVEGAKAYMIVRKGYETNVADGKFDPSYYLVDVSSSQTPKVVLKKLPSAYFKNGSAEVSFSEDDNAYTLKDTAVEWPSDESNGWQKAQARIKWGVPNKYFVLPLKDTGDDVNYDKDRLTEVTVGDNDVVMHNINQVESCGSAIGYGWNVKASKGVELKVKGSNLPNKTVRITWENPYINQYYTGGTVKYGVYRKKEGESKWELLKDAGAVSSQEHFDETADPGVVYEYAVGVTASNTMSNPTNDTQYMSESDKKVVQEDPRTRGEKLAAGFVLPRPMVVNVSRDGRTDGNGILAEDVTWSAVYVGNKQNRMIDGYIIEVYNSNRQEYKAFLGRDDIVWEELDKISFGTNKLKPTPKSGETVKNMVREAPSFTTSFNTGTNLRDNKLKILFDYKHWFRVRAYTDDTETGVTTVSEEYNPNPGTNDWWSPTLNGENGSGYKWGTRGMTHEEFKYAACWLLAQGVNQVGWTASSASWYSKNNNTFFSRSTAGVGGWGFVFNNFRENSFLLADGRLGAETAGSWAKPRYYYTMMGDTNNLGINDSNAENDIINSKGATKKTIWYIDGSGRKWDKDTGLAARPGAIDSERYGKLSEHGWWGTNSKEMIFISPGDESWYTANRVEKNLFNGYIYIYNMPDTQESTNRQHKRWIDTFMFKGYKLTSGRHIGPDKEPGNPSKDPSKADAQSLSYKERHFQEIPYLPKGGQRGTYDPYK